MATRKPKGGRLKRLRVPEAMPKPPVGGTFAWGEQREGLKGLTPAEQAMLLVQTDAWGKHFRPVLEELDRQSRLAHGPTRGYTAEQLEIVLLYGRACGLSSPREIRARLGSDIDPQAQVTLGLPQTVKSPAASTRRAGLPSVATLYRHKQRLDHETRARLFREVFKELREEAMQRPEMIEASRVLHLDGTALFTHYKAPKYKRQPKGYKGPPELLNAPRYKKGKRISGYTAPEAGNRGGDKATGHEPGDGWQCLPITVSLGLPLEWITEKIHEGEPTIAKPMVEKFGREVKPKLGWKKGELAVCTMDGNFCTPLMKQTCHEIGIVPNSHPISHKDSPASEARAEAARQLRLPIHDYRNQIKNWFADGHRQLHCKCGQGTTFRRAEADNKGRAVTRVEGYCPKCGSITITAGNWHKGKNPSKKLTTEKSWFMPMTIAERRLVDQLRAEGRDVEGVDWQFGNFLTFDDPLSRAYGKGRFNKQEGIFGAIENRFGVGRGKSWYRTKAAQEAELAQTFSLIYALSLAHWKHMDQRNQQPATVTVLRPDPPPLDMQRAA